MQKISEKYQTSSQIDKILQTNDCRQSMWSVAQLVLLPLWVLCGTSVAQGFEVDIDIQTVFVAAFGIGITDLYMDRLFDVTFVCQVLESKMRPQIQSVLLPVTVIVQVVFVIIINFATGWRYTASNRGTMSSSRETIDSIGLRTMNDLAIYGFNLYFAITTCIKISKATFGTRPKSGKMWWGPKQTDELLLAIGLLFTFVYVLVFLSTTNAVTNWYMTANPTNRESWLTNLDLEDIEVLYWKSDWTKTHHRL